MPSSFKLGREVLKRGKAANDPNNYRSITITSITGKIL